MLENETKNRASAASQPSDQQKIPSGEIAISVRNLTKKYRIFGNTGDRIKQVLTFGMIVSTSSHASIYGIIRTNERT